MFGELFTIRACACVIFSTFTLKDSSCCHTRTVQFEERFSCRQFPVQELNYTDEFRVEHSYEEHGQRCQPITFYYCLSGRDMWLMNIQSARSVSTENKWLVLCSFSVQTC